MDRNDSMADSPRRRHNLLRDKVQLRKRKDRNRFEIVPFSDPLSFEKGFFVVIRACQLLAQHNEGILFVGVAGPSGAGKTVFTEKVVNLTPDVAVISMDNYNDATRIIDGNFDGTLQSTLNFFPYSYIWMKGGHDTAVKLLPCDREVMVSQVLETPSCRNAGKDCVYKTQSGRTLLRTLRKRELRAPGYPFL
jgi:ABC-type dipeptide/oligopeptide/nickel transport system ATPase component